MGGLGGGVVSVFRLGCPGVVSVVASVRRRRCESLRVSKMDHFVVGEVEASEQFGFRGFFHSQNKSHVHSSKDLGEETYSYPGRGRFGSCSNRGCWRGREDGMRGC